MAAHERSRRDFEGFDGWDGGRLFLYSSPFSFFFLVFGFSIFLLLPRTYVHKPE